MALKFWLFEYYIYIYMCVCVYVNVCVSVRVYMSVLVFTQLSGHRQDVIQGQSEQE